MKPDKIMMFSELTQEQHLHTMRAAGIDSELLSDEAINKLYSFNKTYFNSFGDHTMLSPWDSIKKVEEIAFDELAFEFGFDPEIQDKTELMEEIEKLFRLAFELSETVLIFTDSWRLKPPQPRPEPHPAGIKKNKLPLDK